MLEDEAAIFNDSNPRFKNAEVEWELLVLVLALEVFLLEDGLEADEDPNSGPFIFVEFKEGSKGCCIVVVFVTFMSPCSTPGSCCCTCVLGDKV